MPPELEIILRVLAAATLAGVIGWEREALGKPAGLRTHILVGIGAALAIAVGDALVARLASGHADLMRVDPLRVMEAVLTSIGFLGAGTIIFRRHDDRVSGLTTAASIWATAVVGLAAGAGHYIVAAGTTVIIFIVLRGLGYLEHRGRIVPERPPNGR